MCYLYKSMELKHRISHYWQCLQKQTDLSHNYVSRDDLQCK